MHLCVEHHMNIHEIIDIAQFVRQSRKGKSLGASDNIDVADNIDINVDKKYDNNVDSIDNDGHTSIDNDTDNNFDK